MSHFLRLLHVETLVFKEYHHGGAPPPSYACASHRWLDADTETKYQDFKDGKDRGSRGHQKVLAFAKFVRQHFGRHGKDHIEWLWIDTCCIDKTNAQELSEAVNTMFHIYRAATVCLAYLQDIDVVGHTQLTSSEWFTRGWTLQELLAPSTVVFVDKDWHIIGHKAARHHSHSGPLVNDALATSLQISRTVLCDYYAASVTNSERWAWIRNRRTTRPEDLYYCLMGLFDITMPIIYGEGAKSAEKRLRDAIQPAVLTRTGTLKSRVPGIQNNNLVKREGVLQHIQSKAQPATRVALVGRGGVGKTQLAFQFARHMVSTTPGLRIVSLYAGNATRFDKSVKEAVGRAVEDPGVLYRSSSVYERLEDLLCDERAPWIVIIDAADDVEFLIRPPPGLHRSRIDYLPSTGNGRVLITTRSKLAARKLVHVPDMIEVCPLSEEEALQLLASIIGENAASRSGREIVKQLDYMPLAITNAGIYLYSIGPTLANMERYSEQEIKKGSLSRLEMLKKHEILPDRDSDALNSIILTSHVSFNLISSMQKSATELLCLMSLCDNTNIPRSLLIPQSVDDSFADRTRWQDDISVLLAWDFIAAHDDGNSWYMHSLIQDAARDWLQEQDIKDELQEQLLRRLHRLVIDAEQSGDSYQALLPHAAAMIHMSPSSADCELLQADLLERAASYTIGSGNLTDALNIAKTSLLIRTRHLEPLNELTIRSISIVAEAHRKKGDWRAAIELKRSLIEQIQKADLPDGSDKIRKLSRELASTYAANQAWSDAEFTLLGVLKEQTNSMGDKKVSQEVLRIRTQLASVYLGMGQWARAETMHVEILRDKERFYPDNKVDILLSKGDLAATCKKLGHLSTAERLEIEVLDGRKQLLGPGHRHTLSAMQNLATTYRQQGRYGPSQTLGEEVLKFATDKYGMQDVTTLTCLNDLSLTHYRQGHWDKAYELQVQLVALTEKVFGPDQLRTHTAKALLAATYRNTNRCKEAARLEKSVLKARSEKLGSEHPDTLRAKYNLGLTYFALGKRKKARTIMEDVITRRTKHYGREHAETREAQVALRRMQPFSIDLTVCRRYLGSGIGARVGIALTVLAVLTGMRTWSWAQL